MFIQVIEGKVSDVDGLRRQMDRWQQELQPGAKGWLGTTGGVAADGTAVFLARFESEAAAKANSDRAEQGAWWNETAKYFDGDVSFRNCAVTDSTLAGGSDDAGFVQIMRGRAKSRDRLLEIEARFLPKLIEQRPEVLGSTRGWDGDRFVEAVYFTSEADARKGETSMSDGDTDADLAEYMALAEDLTYTDLTDPWLASP